MTNMLKTLLMTSSFDAREVN